MGQNMNDPSGEIELRYCIFNTMLNGLELYKSGKLREAIKQFTDILDKKPNYKTAYYKRAIVYNAMGDKNAVLEDLKIAAGLGYKNAQRVLKLHNIDH